MSVTHGGVTLPKTTTEKKALTKKILLRALTKIRNKQLITNKRERLVLGIGLNRMTTDQRRLWFTHMTGSANPKIWEDYARASQIYPCRVWAKRVTNRTKLFKSGDCRLAGKTQEIIDCQRWILSVINNNV